MELLRVEHLSRYYGEGPAQVKALDDVSCFYKSYVPGLFCCYVWYVWPIFTIASLREWNCVLGNMEFSAA